MADDRASWNPRDAAAFALLEHGPTAVITVRAGTIEFANAAAVRLATTLRIDRSEEGPGDAGTVLAGRPLSVLGPEIAAVHRDTTVESELSVAGCDMTLTLAVRAVPDPEESETRVLIIRDLTTSRQLEQRLRERRAILEAVIESLPFDFWMNDLSNRTVLQNSHSRRLWGEQFGTHMADVQSDPDILARWEDSNTRALAGDTVTGEITYVVDGTPRVFRNIVAPVVDNDTIIGIFGANIDITDLKRALHDRDVLLQELNHRVKNHLQMIISMIYLQRGDAPAGEARSLERIEERVHAIYLVHDQLYAAAALDTVDLHGYLHRLIDGIRAGYSRTIHGTYIGDSSDINYQRATSLGIVVTELIVNAIRHGRTDGPIEVTLRLEAHEYVLTVANEVAVPTGSPSGDREVPGGLAIVQHVSGQLHGSLSVRQNGNRYSAILRFPSEKTAR